MICEKSHGLVLSFGDDNHSNRGAWILTPTMLKGILPNKF